MNACLPTLMIAEKDKNTKSPTCAQRFIVTKSRKRKDSLVRGLLLPGLGFRICEVRVVLNNTKALTRVMVLLGRPKRQEAEQERVFGPRET